MGQQRRQQADPYDRSKTEMKFFSFLIFDSHDSPVLTDSKFFFDLFYVEPRSSGTADVRVDGRCKTLKSKQKWRIDHGDNFALPFAFIASFVCFLYMAMLLYFYSNTGTYHFSQEGGFSVEISCQSRLMLM
jgi:hypothetical protein